MRDIDRLIGINITGSPVNIDGLTTEDILRTGDVPPITIPEIPLAPHEPAVKQPRNKWLLKFSEKTRKNRDAGIKTKRRSKRRSKRSKKRSKRRSKRISKRRSLNF
jgi:hypothetical protein